ncbi:MAG: hypothetical protein AABX02_04070 [archaeon]
MSMNKIAVGFTVLIIVVSLGIIYAVSQWELPKPITSPTSNEPTWVLLQPQKCTEIPWRKAWAEQNGKPYTEFPVASELTIMKSYYQQKGITIFDIDLTYQGGNATCLSCGCPEPFVFAVQTTQSDAARLAVSGFTILDNSNPEYFTGKYYRQSSAVSYVPSSDCDKLFSTQTALDELLGSKKDSCYIQAAISEKNVDVCANVYSTKAQHTCVTEVAVAMKDVSLCQKASNASGKDGCIASVAGILQKPEYCVQITDSTAKYFCEVGAKPQ